MIQVTLLLLSIAVGLEEGSYLYPVGYLIFYNVFSAIFLTSGYYGVAKKKRSQDELNARFRGIKNQLTQILDNE